MPSVSIEASLIPWEGIQLTRRTALAPTALESARRASQLGTELGVVPR